MLAQEQILWVCKLFVCDEDANNIRKFQFKVQNTKVLSSKASIMNFSNASYSMSRPASRSTPYVGTGRLKNN
jgi:hypothetical protein